MIITILMSCTLSTTDVVAALDAYLPASGVCTGSYHDKASQKLIGAWSISLEFARDAKTPHGLRVIRRKGGIVVPEMEENTVALKELEGQTLGFIAEKVREAHNKGISVDALPGGI